MEKESNDWIYAKTIQSNGKEGFSMSVAALLVGSDAESCIPNFRKSNIGMEDVGKLTNEDLIMLGVDNPITRKNLINVFSNVSFVNDEVSVTPGLNKDISNLVKCDVINDSVKQLQRIKLSVQACKILFKKSQKPADKLLMFNCFTSEAILKTIDKIDNTLLYVDSLDGNHKSRDLTGKKIKPKKKKILTAAIGSSIIIGLTICFVKSLKDLL